MSEWRTVKLGDIIEIYDHKRIPLSSTERQGRQGVYPYYGASGIIDYIDDYIFDGRYILIAEDGENLNSRKLPIAFFADGQFWVNNHAHIVRAKAEVADDYFIVGWFAQADISGYITGTAQPKLSQANLKQIEIPLPPLETQRRIAAILSAYDDLIENNTRRIKALEQAAHDLYREWFVAFRFPGHESVPLVDSGTEYGMIPQGWEVGCLGNIAEDKRNSIHPSELESDMPYVGLEHIPRKTIALSEWGRAGEVNSTKLVFEVGDILFAKIRPYLHKVAVAPVNGVSSTDAIIIVPKYPEFYALVLMCVSGEHFVEYATTTSQGTQMPRANWKVLAKYPVVIPPQEILQEFNEFVIDIVNDIRTNIFRNNALREARDLLLPRLVSGELDVSEIELRDLS